jgi:hypothetical protein
VGDYDFFVAKKASSTLQPFASFGIGSSRHVKLKHLYSFRLLVKFELLVGRRLKQFCKTQIVQFL